MHIRSLGDTLVALGVVVFLASLFADTLGIGGNPDFGPVQITGLIFGPVISFIGFNVRGQAD